MEKIKTLEDFRLHPHKFSHRTGIIYDIDKDYIYIVEILINRDWFHSCGERYKLKHNFKQDEIDKIDAGTYINFFVTSKTEFMGYKNIMVKKAKEGHKHKDCHIFEMLD